MTRVDSARAETSPGTPAPARQRTVHAALAVAGACWLLLSSFVLAYALLALALSVQSFVLGYGAEGPLAVAWWNDKVTGGLLLVLCATPRSPSSRTSSPNGGSGRTPASGSCRTTGGPTRVWHASWGCALPGATVTE
jgi:hypothetical protein